MANFRCLLLGMLVLISSDILSLSALTLQKMWRPRSSVDCFTSGFSSLLTSHIRFQIDCEQPPGLVMGKQESSAISLKTRRQLTQTIFMALLTSSNPTPTPALDLRIGNVSPASGGFGAIRDDVASSFRYKKILGKGTFKTVYSVFYNLCDDNDAATEYDGVKNNMTGCKNFSYAMAVERLRSKSETRDEIRGIQIVEHIQRQLSENLSTDDGKYFESIESWWIQSIPIAQFEQDNMVFPDFTNVLKDRTRKRPTLFIGKTWVLVSFKPVYIMDLKTFIRKCPCSYEINEGDGEPFYQAVREMGGISLTEQGALRLVYELCHAGKIMHDDLGIVHRDIKPKNIMLTSDVCGGHPVIIDFGFADFGTTLKESGNSKRTCVTELGIVKGEVNYSLAEDVALYRGCEEGDMFAMGRTIYEVIFGSSELQQIDSGKRKITMETVIVENQALRERVEAQRSGKNSRFPLSKEAHDSILYVVDSLCRQNNPLPFREVEAYMKAKV